ncbi:molybdopterin molybdotransferase MoeA [Galbibacter sp. BG1]|uniref:molybdopterin molybdotransferase MoeA n=1 Tax=Galbibacter sp. BG1 TaxID=1170699 RepID=UPI0015BE55C8|nr:gephyrin-like molybdotransferase Glp [Galbibacter sp. BG1]QLE02583.1 molybdopterin molybdotransferase MoeA [Galbibacter sp. BG1]
MITVKEALAFIKNNCTRLENRHMPLRDAIGFTLAEDIFSKIDLPPFRQSAMDGYAIREHESFTYKVIGELQAGDSADIHLKRGEAVRIFTGAKVPETATRILMQEHVSKSNKIITYQKAAFGKTNVKDPGEQIKKGAVALPQGTLLNTAAIAFLSGLGIGEVAVYKMPKVAILVTGNELQIPGTQLAAGKIFDSNSIMLQLLLKKAGIQELETIFVGDTKKETVAIVKQLLNDYDFLIASGGISVGEYDLMRDAFKVNGVNEHFYKINQRPGKPIYFGTTNKATVFGLPGNPAACFINFQAYVLPALQLAMGQREVSRFKKAQILESLANNTGKCLFLRATVSGNTVKVASNQSSSMLQSLIAANALVYIPSETNVIEKGTEVYYLDILQ